jgi:hypothetical protein
MIAVQLETRAMVRIDGAHCIGPKVRGQGH